jgi:hypothetical protein
MLANKMSRDITNKIPDIGRLKNNNKFPSNNFIDCSKEVSINFPRTKVNTIGAIGISSFFNKYPNTPKNSITPTFHKLLLTLYAPNTEIIKIIGYRSFGGIKAIFAQTLASGKFMKSKIKLPINILAIIPHTKSGLFWNIVGPGVNPCIINAPRIIAIVGELGIPSVSNGIKAAPL